MTQEIKTTTYTQPEIVRHLIGEIDRRIDGANAVIDNPTYRGQTRYAVEAKVEVLSIVRLRVAKAGTLGMLRHIADTATDQALRRAQGRESYSDVICQLEHDERVRAWAEAAILLRQYAGSQYAEGEA